IQELEYPSLDEYNFHQETILKNLNIFGNEHVRSRLIVLSCGAGKSLVGVTAASKINKSLIFCNSNVQLFTSSDEDKLNDSCICISAYRIIAPIEQSNDKITQRW
ncbi:unnamed protein product, partial [Rotaria sp. Silwood2]